MNKFKLSGMLVVAMIGFGAVTTSAIADSQSGELDTKMPSILAQYLTIQAALAQDSLEGVESAAKTIGTEAASIDVDGITGEHSERYRKVPPALVAASNELTKAKTIEDAREVFKRLSSPMTMWATMAAPANVDVVYCAMANASWLQAPGAVKNPYYGADMLGCGEVVSAKNE